MKAKITINEAKQAKQDDIFTAGNVVVSKETGNIVLVSCSYVNVGTFDGLVINDGECFLDEFPQCNFVQFYGSITISTEG